MVLETKDDPYFNKALHDKFKDIIRRIDLCDGKPQKQTETQIPQILT
jgi:hypothetical protein